VRWERLFGDLEAQLEAAERAELDDEVADRTRREVARTELVDRLRAATGSRLDVTLRGTGVVTATVERVGADWVLLAESHRATLLAPVAAITSVRNLGRAAAAPPDEVARRLDVRFVLRGLARDRAAVALLLDDGAALTGTIDRVGADHLDLAEHPLDVPRRTGLVPAVRTVPLAALTAVRSAPHAR
jgi:hypothetical protein